MNNTKYIISKLKKDTNNSDEIIYRKKQINNNTIYIIYNEPLVSSNTISDYIIRSLNHLSRKNIPINKIIANNIDNIKIKSIYTYQDITYYLNNGFTIILIEESNTYFALETKRNLSRGINTPQTENTLRGAMDSFVEDIQTNMGLIKKRIKSTNLWYKSNEIGKYTKTKVNILYINNIANKKLVNYLNKTIKKINIDGILSIGTIKNLIEKENKSVFPTIISTERPDKTCEALLQGRIVILADNSQFALILPITLNDLFISTEDNFGKSINITLTRIIRYISFFITILTPAIYLALITYNQYILPERLLINFTIQRTNVPFPAFIEALIMMTSFEILRECDLRSPNFSNSAMSTVGALILGSAAAEAKIVSPIMIIIIAITSLSSLLFTEPEIINGIRWYRLLFMLSASIMGITGIFLFFIYFITKLCSLNSFTTPYLVPFSPLSITGIKNSIIKLPTKKLNKRLRFFTKNITRYKEENK